MEQPDEWLQNQLDEDELSRQLILEQSMNAKIGMAADLREVIYTDEFESYYSGLLLVGPPGTGRHSAAYAVAQELHKESGYAITCISGGSISDGADSFLQVSKRFRALCRWHLAQSENLCVIMEHLEQCPYPEQFYSFLSGYAFHNQTEATVFFLLIAESKPNLPLYLKNRLMNCQFALPDLEQRKQFLNWKTKDSAVFGYGEKIDLLAERTEGYSYGMLSQLVSNLDFHSRSGRHCLPDDLLIRLIEQHLAAEGLEDPLVTAISELKTTIGTMLKQMPAMSAATRTAVSSDRRKKADESQHTEDDSEQEDDIAARRYAELEKRADPNEIAKKTTYDLLIGLYGQSSVDGVFQKTEFNNETVFSEAPQIPTLMELDEIMSAN